MSVMIRILAWIVCLASSTIGLFSMMSGMIEATGAPQQAAAAAFGAAMAVIPYCAARAIDQLANKPVVPKATP